MKLLWENLNELESFKKLLSLKDHVKLADVLTADRVCSCQIQTAGALMYNYAAKQADEQVLRILQELADEASLIEKYTSLLSGEIINTGENRKVYHHLTRGTFSSDQAAVDEKARSFYEQQQKSIESFAQKVHSGALTNAAGQTFTDVVQIGIGGSDLGPRAMYLALEQYARASKSLRLKAHFISNVDPDDASGVLSRLDLSRCLFILVSKSGTTQETLANELFVKQFLIKAGLDPSRHMIAVTSETSPLANNPAYLSSFYIDDFIGGRFSSTSAVGTAVLTLSFGSDICARFLQGAHEADAAALNTCITENAALLDALIGVYERNVMGYPATAVLPYSQALSRFPAHLQQADMESNGKQVNRFGAPVTYATGSVIFGEPGTNGQHSFYQLLHQGTDIVPLQFIGFTQNQTGNDITVEGSTSQQKLCANLAAQIAAFALGKTDTNSNKNFPGGRPSSVIYGNQLTPEALGALLAHYENKIMFQGFLWNVNSFDQEGVQLGKVLTKKVLSGQTDGALSAYAKLFGL